MILTINQAGDIIVLRGTEEFLLVKRKFGLKVISKFYRNEELIFESSLLNIFIQKVNIRFQNLPDIISLEKSGWLLYSLCFNNKVLSFEVKHFSRPAYRLFNNYELVGTIGNPSLISVGGRFYEMDIDTDNEKEVLYFLILFLSQLPAF